MACGDVFKYFEMEPFATFEVHVLLMAEQAFTEARIEHLSQEDEFVSRRQLCQ